MGRRALVLLAVGYSALCMGGCADAAAPNPELRQLSVEELHRAVVGHEVTVVGPVDYPWEAWPQTFGADGVWSRPGDIPPVVQSRYSVTRAGICVEALVPDVGCLIFLTDNQGTYFVRHSRGARKGQAQRIRIVAR